MDLSRAKTVLIYTFLILNIFLAYQMWQDEGCGTWRLFERKEDISRLEANLQDVNLYLETSLPRDGSRIAHLIVEPWRIKAEDVISELWNALEKNSEAYPVVLQDEYSVLNDDSNITVYNFGDYELSLIKGGAMALKGLHYEKNENTTSEDMRQAAQRLVDSISFLNDFIFDYMQISEQGLVVNYRQEYGEYSLYAGYLQFFWDEQGKMGFYLYRLEPINFAEQEREIIPPSSALLRFLDIYEGGDQETSIIEFSLGYYSREYDAQRWEIPPVWRIRLGNGEVYYINSFTGHLEK